MTPKEFLKGKRISEAKRKFDGYPLGYFELKADILEEYHQSKLKLLGIGDVVGQSEKCCEPLGKDSFYLGTTCPKCNKPFRNVSGEQHCLQRFGYEK